MERIIKRGDIYYAELNPVISSEQGGNRPVLIIREQAQSHRNHRRYHKQADKKQAAYSFLFIGH